MMNGTKSTLRLLALVLAVAVSHNRVAASESTDNASEATRQQLKNLESEWSSAFVRADVPALERLLANEFILTSARGRVTSKAEEIDGAREGGLLSNTVSDLMVRVYENTAVVTGNLTLVAKEKPDEPLKYRITDVWILRDGRWQAVAGHISNLSAK